MNALARIVVQTREEVDRRRRDVPIEELESVAAERSASLRPFAAALARPGLSVIAEHKRRSPSAGLIREGVAIEAVVRAYERGGAAAISVLTEGPNFGGSLADLQSARDASALPLLRKDFVVDSYQVTEALAAGADAILLIVAALSEADLSALYEAARAADLAVLVEVHDEHELERALGVGAEIIGMNNRDLTTLTVDTARTFQLLAGVPEGTTVVAESGFRTRSELDELERAGVDAVLVGEALMRSPEIEDACRTLAGGRPLAGAGGTALGGSVSPL